MQNFDVVIIGGGVAGISAASWCDELGLKTLLLEANSELGGQLLWTFNPIKNYLGIETENGQELQNIFLKQIQNRQFKIKLKVEIKSVNLTKKQVSLKNGDVYKARFLIIATGVKRRKLKVKGEDLQGVLASGKRDSNLTIGKTVCVIGGGDAALENALILAEKAAKVYLIHRRKIFSGREEFIKQIEQNSKIEVVTETIIQEIIGTEKVEAVYLNNNRKLLTDFVIIRIGVEPNTEILQEKIDTDSLGYIVTNSIFETSVKDVFAIGDVANQIAPTISSAAGMGATAAKAINSKI